MSDIKKSDLVQGVEFWSYMGTRSPQNFVVSQVDIIQGAGSWSYKRYTFLFSNLKTGKTVTRGHYATIDAFTTEADCKQHRHVQRCNTYREKVDRVAAAAISIDKGPLIDKALAAELAKYSEAVKALNQNINQIISGSIINGARN